MEQMLSRYGTYKHNWDGEFMSPHQGEPEIDTGLEVVEDRCY